MINFPLDPALTRPLRIHTLADALTSFYADMSLNPWKFGTDQQQRNTYFLVRRTANAICLLLGKSSAQIALDEILELDDDLILVALKEEIDRKHASIYATGCRKIIEYSRSCGWSCNTVLCREAWEPVLQALTGTKDCAIQLVKFLIAAGKTPAETSEADLWFWHGRATKDGMLPATADGIVVRFRRRMRRSGLEHLFPHLDLTLKKASSYRKKKAWAPAICAEVEKLIATRAPIYLPGRDARKAWRPASIKNTVESVCAIYGCLEDELKRGPFDCLAEMFTTTNLCDSIDWLGQRGLLRQGIQRILGSILALAKQFPNLDSGQVRKHIKQIPREPNHLMRGRKQEKSLPYDALSEIPGKLQKLIDAGGLSKLDVAWILHDKALISTLHELLLRQLNLRECKMPNLVWEPLNEKMLRNLIIPDSVRAAYNADPSHTRKFMMLKYKEEETKGKRAQTEVLSLDLAATLQAYLDVRQWLLEQINAKKLKLEPDRGTLFFNRHGRALKEHNLRSHVMRLTRNYAGKAIPPHLWRDIYAQHFRILLAIGVENDPEKLPKRFWHIDQPTTDKYSHLDKALPGIAMLNQQYRASQQTLRKETSLQLVQPELRKERAA